MPVKPARSYHSPQRDEQANATRRHILLTAERLFGERGFPAVTMGDIARQADISLATVYLYFTGKAAVVAGLAEQLAASGELSVEQVEGQEDPIQQLRLAAHIIRRLNERAWLIADILRAARGTDEGLMNTWQLWQERHLSAVRRGIASLDRGGAPSGSVPLDDVVDVFYALAGTDVFRSLVRERGWSPEQYEGWLFGLACRELIDNPT